MAIGNFVSAGVVFHNYGKRDVSLALICSAIDATAQKVFPSERKNNNRNKKFISKYLRIITAFGFPGILASGIRIKCENIRDLHTDRDGYVGIEDIIYHIIRCGLIHECEIDSRIEFTDDTIIDDFDGVFKIPKQVFWGLALAVILCEKNIGEVTADEVSINLNGKDFAIDELWGQEGNLPTLLKR
ncbi:MAG: hypothetical protein JNM22_03915 [Saprospiraceae bacterium]|nr:hypothetical protein [Saprospiraceae bacterium]